MQVASERYAAVRKRLEELCYHQPLGVESVPLVEALISDLNSSNSLITEIRKQADAQAQDLIVAQNQVSGPYPAALGCCSDYDAPAPRRARVVEIGFRHGVR